VMEFAKGSSGELRLRRETSFTDESLTTSANTNDVDGDDDGGDGVDFVLQTLMVDDREPYGKSWQYGLGRLVVLDEMIRQFSAEFLFDNLSDRLEILLIKNLILNYKMSSQTFLYRPYRCKPGRRALGSVKQVFIKLFKANGYQFL
jgi:hypothetical protein